MGQAQRDTRSEQRYRRTAQRGFAREHRSSPADGSASGPSAGA